MKKILAVLIVLIASGCTQLPQFEQKSAELITKVNDDTVTSDSPGQITLNARNQKNNSSFYYATVRPVGDYQNLVEVTDRNGDPKSGFGLGEAPKGATTGETFAQVRKKMNVSSTVRLKIKLFRESDEKEVDSTVEIVRLKEEE